MNLKNEKNRWVHVMYERDFIIILFTMSFGGILTCSGPQHLISVLHLQAFQVLHLNSPNVLLCVRNEELAHHLDQHRFRQ